MRIKGDKAFVGANGVRSKYVGTGMVGKFMQVLWVIGMTRLGAGVIVLVLIWQAWRLFGPQPKELSALRQAVAEEACEIALGRIPDNPDVFRVAVLPFERDYTGKVTDILRAKFSESGRYNISDKRVFDRARELLNLEPSEISSQENALRIGKQMEVDAVIYGSVPRLLQDGSTASISLSVTMLRVPEGERLAAFDFQHSLEPELFSEAYARMKSEEGSLIGRLLLWAVVCAALPLVLTRVVQSITVRDSNALNLLLVTGLVFVNLLLALLIVGIDLTTLFGGFLLLIVLATAAVYNYAICTRIDELAR